MRFVVAWIRTRQFPQAIGPELWLGVIGVGVFAAAWLWSLATSLAILREARRRPPAP